MAIAELIMPKMGESIMEATILKWHKKVGDFVKLDETVLDIATDKVDSEIPSPFEGTLTEIVYPVNAVVPVGSVIAKIQTGVVSNSIPASKPIDVVAAAPSAAPVFTPPPIVEPIISAIVPHEVEQPIQSFKEEIPFIPQQTTVATTSGNNRFFSPLVLNIANSEGLSLSELERIPGTGADGRVSKKDIIQYIADKKAGKVSAFTAQQAPPQVVYIQQEPINSYQHPTVANTVAQKVADAPIYIPPTIVEQPINFPTQIAQPTQPSILEQPINFPSQGTQSFETSKVEPLVSPVSDIAAPSFNIPEPIVSADSHNTEIETVPKESIVYPTVNQSTHEEVSSQQIVQPVSNPYPIDSAVHYEPVATTLANPVSSESVSAPLMATSNDTVEQFVPTQQLEKPLASNEEIINQIPQPIIELTQNASATNSENPYQSIVEPIAYANPVFEVVKQPIIETVVTQQPVVKVVNQQVAVEAPSISVSIPTPIVEAPKSTEAKEATKEIHEKLIPVYLVPPKTPSVPLVTLAEGDSGKFTSPSSANPSGNVEIIEMDRMRKMIAKHMVDSKHISPHVTSFTEADVTNMVFWRERVKGDFEKREGVKLTFTPMFIDCLVKVLKKYPLLNSSVDGDKIIIKKDLNIGMATALPTGNLIVPVIKGADQLNIVGLSSAVNKLASDARNNQLKPDDVSGGTFTFTNVGTFGTLMGTPIINQPQVAILAVGMIKKRPVVIESPNNDTIGIRHMMYLSLSYDHRIIDGSVGASFLSDVAKEFEQWDLNRTWYHYL